MSERLRHLQSMEKLYFWMWKSFISCLRSSIQISWKLFYSLLMINTCSLAAATAACASGMQRHLCAKWRSPSLTPSGALRVTQSPARSTQATAAARSVWRPLSTWTTSQRHERSSPLLLSLPRVSSSPRQCLADLAQIQQKALILLLLLQCLQLVLVWMIQLLFHQRSTAATRRFHRLSHLQLLLHR